jgi:CHAT domain-containing protein
MVLATRLLRWCGAAACAALFGIGPVHGAPDPVPIQRLLATAVQEAMAGDAARAIGLYRQVIDGAGQELARDRVTAGRVVAGLLHAYERAGRGDEAIAFLETDPFARAAGSAWRPLLCQLYLKRGKLEQAVPACTQAQEEEARRVAAQPQAQLALAGRALAIRQSLFEIASVTPDAGAAVFRQADQTGNSAFSRPGESFLRTLSPHALLARLHAQRGDRAALLRYYEEGFTPYARDLERRLAPLAPATGFQPLEDDYALLAALMGGAGARSEGLQAVRASLALNATRTRFIASQYNPALLAGTLATRRAKLGLLAALVLRAPEPQALAGLAGELLQAKGALSELLALRHARVMRSGDPELVALYQSAETAAANGDEAAWRAAALRLDAAIPAWLPDTLFEDGAGFFERVAARLGGETLVSVLRQAPFDLATQAYGAPRYLALCLRGGALQVQDLGAADEIDLLVQRYRSEAAAAQAGATGDARLRALARQLYARILAPVLGERLPAGQYVADLDGLLNLLPLEALVDGSDRHLLEAGSWRHVSSARALLREGAGAPAPAGRQAVLLVDPAFSAAPGRRAAPSNDLRRSLAAAAGRFAPLPETRDEGRQVARALRRMGLQTTLLAGRRADPAALSALKSPRVLHIATHGFLLEQEAPARPGLFSAEAASGGMAGGVALAGAQDGEGLVFISQFRTLDLAGTELAVLSACDTGVGSVRSGEGLNSLRQGLELAGARAQVTALWKVPSSATARLMARFYDRLAQGMPAAQALREAKLAVRATHPHPLFWAGFTLSGQGR